MVVASGQSATAHAPEPSSRATTAEREHRESYRPDVQGLRAIAVSMVVIYHLYPKVLPGGFVGVDVFFVISGFLITGHLARGYERHGRVRLLDFWGRRARRLLPAAALVLTATWLASRVLLSASRLPATAEQVRASALYFQNWVLARDAVDYLTAADAPSPVQHFWSLSVEEQFYLGWPFVFVIAALIGLRGHRRAARGALFGMVAVVVVASLVYSSHLTGTDPAAAYFVTTTRVWELAIGGLLALLASSLRTVLGRQSWLGWIGLGMVIASVFVIDGSSPFPGTIALLPVGGAALLIASGARSAVRGPWRLTSNRPMVFLGDISYSLYLWHWPIIVLWKSYTGGKIGYLGGSAIVVAAVLLSWATKVFVEDRVRLSPAVTRNPARSLATALTVLVPVALVAFYTPPHRFVGKLDPTHVGATALVRHLTVANVNPIPSPAQAPLDFDPFSSCETPIQKTKPRPCFYGDRRNPKLTMMLVGDSVAGQYRSIFADMARAHHWLVISDLHGQCPWTATMMARMSSGGAPYTQCHDWGAQVMHDMLTKYHPDIVVTSERPVLGTPSHRRPDAVSFGQAADGMVTYWRQLAAHGTKVVAVRETPEPKLGSIPDCMSKPNATAKSCTASTRRSIVQDTPLQQAVTKFGTGAELVDINSLICTATQCPPIIGNVFVYRDQHHLTRTYLHSLEPYFTRKLLATRAVRSKS